MRSILNLGDSITISLYPELDAKERYGKDLKGLGAGDLLHKNNDEVFPELTGLDLNTFYPGSQHFNLAQDGATIPGVYNQIRHSYKLVDPQVVDLITLTIGGNDLLQAYAKAKTVDALDERAIEIEDNFNALVDHLKATYPNATLILNSVYDPTDGTALMPGRKDKLPLEILWEFNRAVDEKSDSGRSIFVDIHDLFMNYGVKMMYPDGKTLKNKNGYYWHHSIIEPNIFGASALRMAWLEALEVE